MQVRDLLVRARTSSGAARSAAITEAVGLLRRTDGLTLRGGVTVAVDDRAVADRVGSAAQSVSSWVDAIDLLIAATDRASDPQIDPATADRQLSEALRDLPAASGPSGLVDAISRAVLRFISGIEGPTIDFWLILPIIGLLGTAVIVFVLATLGRGLPERVRREVVLREPGAIDRPDPAVHLRAADEALAAGRARDAIHSLYLFVITSLAAREILRYDPTLTNRELIVRAAAIPHADALREIIATYERSWFGLREPTRDEAERARGLATRVAG